jgi:phosphatidylglycerophosphate synthase
MTNDLNPNRRPIADVFRKSAHAAVRWCVAKNVSPDLISWLSVFAAAAAAVCFALHHQANGLLLAGAFFCMVRLWCNMLDGMVAIAANKTSKKGEIVNEFPDRISDVLVFVGIAHSHPSCLVVGYWAAIGALFTAYIGILSQAASAPRQFGGVMSKPWRMVVVSFMAGLIFIAPALEQTSIEQWNVSLFAIACGIVILGCLQTTFVRYRSAMTWLAEHR